MYFHQISLLSEKRSATLSFVSMIFLMVFFWAAELSLFCCALCCCSYIVSPQGVRLMYLSMFLRVAGLLLGTRNIAKNRSIPGQNKAPKQKTAMSAYILGCLYNRRHVYKEKTQKVNMKLIAAVYLLMINCEQAQPVIPLYKIILTLLVSKSINDFKWNS